MNVPGKSVHGILEVDTVAEGLGVLLWSYEDSYIYSPQSLHCISKRKGPFCAPREFMTLTIGIPKPLRPRGDNPVVRTPDLIWKAYNMVAWRVPSIVILNSLYNYGEGHLK